MKAWAVQHPGPAATGPLAMVDRPAPEPGPGEVRVLVSTCGVCRTDLHLTEGDLAPRHPGVVPGHPEELPLPFFVGSRQHRAPPRVRAAPPRVMGPVAPRANNPAPRKTPRCVPLIGRLVYPIMA